MMGCSSATGRAAALTESSESGRPQSTDPASLAARLTWIFVDQTAAATPEQRAAVVRWQGRDRFYQEVQLAVLEDNAASDDARDVADTLTSLAVPITQAVVVWRGIRSTTRTFGVPVEQLPTLTGRRFDIDRFFSTTVDRRVAESEFTDPGRAPALYKITVQGGTEAVWLPPLGDPEEARQQELLLLPGSEARIVAVETSGVVPVVVVEVSDG